MIIEQQVIRIKEEVTTCQINLLKGHPWKKSKKNESIIIFRLVSGFHFNPAEYTLNSNIEQESDKEVQADFSCEITSDKLDKTKIYKSFEISASDAISGIP